MVPLLKDFKLFETLSDVKFAKLYGISSERARQLREKHAPHTILEKRRRLRIENIDAQILQYIKEHNDKIRLVKFCEDANICRSNKFNLRAKFVKIAKENNIKLNLSPYRLRPSGIIQLHGANCGRKKCYCDIGKLATNIRCSCAQKGYSLNASLIDELANKYINTYKEDRSFHHKNFWDELYKEIETRLDLNNTNLGQSGNAS